MTSCSKSYPEYRCDDARTSPTFTCGGLAILPNLKKLIHGLRQAGRPVIFSRHVHHPGFLDAGIMGWWWEGSPENKIHPGIQPLPGEKVILKHRYSTFYNTDLETILRCLKVEDLVMSGIMTNMCCESTTLDASFRDYRVFFWPMEPVASTRRCTSPAC